MNVLNLSAASLGLVAWSAAVAAPVPSARQNIAPDYLKPAPTRAFSVEYTGKVPEVPAGARLLRVWLPVPLDSSVQTIKDLAFTPAPKSIGTEPKYGNRIACFEFARPAGGAEVAMKWTCTRREVRVDMDKLQPDGKDAPGAFAAFKSADRLVLVDDEMRALAAKVTAGRTTTGDKARAIYDYVVGNMTYDKNHTGWGLGSTRHACDVGKGNCTDFHALFNSLCRASGIASGFEIGLYLPYEQGKDEPLGGYHCWAFFRVPGRIWVPVDCSESQRFPERKEFFFGGHTANRVTLSTGRDITLVPRQAGEPLNYFLNPYAEADGKPVKTEKTWSYTDLK
jgi:transglutaminase-like putative cysteine protease